MKAKVAKVITVNGTLTPNGREKIARVKSGEKGTGRQFGSDVIYWPWSGASCDQADRILDEIAKENDLELVEGANQ
jgi:hypothetical protein